MAVWLNRRRFQRRPIELPVAYRSPGGGTCWTRSCDLSAGGMRMRTLEPLRIGTALDLRLHLTVEGKERILSSHGTIVWCHNGEGKEPLRTCGVVFQNIQMTLARLP